MEVQLEYFAPGVKKVVSRGFGDTVERITKATGIKYIVDTIAKATNSDCGCDKRKEILNNLIPYKNDSV